MIGADQKFSQEKRSERTCQHAPGRSHDLMRTLRREFNPFSRAGGSRSTRHRNGRKHCTVVLPRISFHTICTTTSVVERSAQAFVSSLPSVALPAIACQTGCASSAVTSKILYACRSRCHHP